MQNKHSYQHAVQRLQPSVTQLSQLVTDVHAHFPTDSVPVHVPSGNLAFTGVTGLGPLFKLAKV